MVKRTRLDIMVSDMYRASLGFGVTSLRMAHIEDW